MMLAGLPVGDDAVQELANLVRAAGAGDLADRLERAVADGVALLALTLDDKSIILDRSKTHPKGSASYAACS